MKWEEWLAFGQVIGIIIIWIRFESRISRLEGRFDEFKDACLRSMTSVEKRHGAQ